MANNEKATLIIFPPSSGCELIRWLLELYAVPHIVISHTAPFFLSEIQKRGGTTFPFLEYKNQKISGQVRIFQYLEGLAADDKKLLPEQGRRRDDVTDIWNNIILHKLDSAATRWAYAYLLPHKRLVQGAITKDVSWWQKLAVAAGYAKIADGIKNKLNITDTTVRETEKDIRESFDKIDKILSDGRTFLGGDKLTIADIGFAALAAPVTLEPLYGHGGLLPHINDVPEAMRKTVEEMRARPSGLHSAKIYKNYRG